MGICERTRTEFKDFIDDLKEKTLKEIDGYLKNNVKNLLDCKGKCPYHDFCYAAASFCPLDGSPIHGTPKGREEFNFNITAKYLLERVSHVEIPRRDVN